MMNVRVTRCSSSAKIRKCRKPLVDKKDNQHKKKPVSKKRQNGKQKSKPAKRKENEGKKCVPFL